MTPLEIAVGRLATQVRDLAVSIRELKEAVANNAMVMEEIMVKMPHRPDGSTGPG